MHRRREATVTDAEKVKAFVELLYRGRPAVSCNTGAELTALLATSTSDRRKSKSKTADQSRKGRFLLLEANGKSLRLRKTKKNAKAPLEPGRGGRTVKRLKLAKLTDCRQLQDTGTWGENLLLLQFQTGRSSKPAKIPDEVVVLCFQDDQKMAQFQNMVRGVREASGPVDSQPPTAEGAGQKGKVKWGKAEETKPGSAVYIWRRAGSEQRPRFRLPEGERTVDLREVLYMKRINFVTKSQEPSMEYTRVSVFTEAPTDFPPSLLTVPSTSTSSSSSSSSSLTIPSPPSPYAEPKVVT